MCCQMGEDVMLFLSSAFNILGLRTVIIVGGMIEDIFSGLTHFTTLLILKKSLISEL